MRAGLLTEQIKIMGLTKTKNQYGEEIEVWSEKYTTRARLLHLRGSRTNTNGEMFYTHTKQLQVRDYVPVTNYDRVVWGGQTYRVTDIEPNRAQMMLTIQIELINE